jgi:hypothetical protein
MVTGGRSTTGAASTRGDQPEMQPILALVPASGQGDYQEEIMPPASLGPLTFSFPLRAGSVYY